GRESYRRPGSGIRLRLVAVTTADRLRLLTILWLSAAVAVPASGASQANRAAALNDATASPGSVDGPAAPIPPAVAARDASGRITLRATRLERPLEIDGRLD